MNFNLFSKRNPGRNRETLSGMSGHRLKKETLIVAKKVGHNERSKAFSQLLKICFRN